MTPAFSILVDGEDRSAVIGDRLLSLLVTDEDGSKADRVEIELDNRDGRIAFPAVDAGLRVSLGFRGLGLSVMGVYAVDGVSGRGPVRALTITATAADLKGDIRAPRTRAWTERTLSDIAATIAGEAGLKPVIGESLRGIRWPYLAQTAESNLHFLSRLAAELDATCKPAGGALVVQRRGEGKTAAGDTLVPPVVTPRRLSDWSWSWKGRTVYRAAEAEWTETGTGYDLHMMPYSSLAQRWDAHGVDRTGSYSGALWLTEFTNPYGGWPATDSAEGIDTLQRLYWYALTAQAKGCRALFIYPPWSPASATDEVLDSQTMAQAVFWQDWLGQHVQIPVYVMPVPVIVRRIRAHLSPGSPFKAGDDLHLSNSDNGAPRTSTMAALGAGLIMMMTGRRLPDDPGWSAQMRDLVGIVWDAIAEYACTGLGGTTVVAPASGGDPLPAPLGLPA